MRVLIFRSVGRCSKVWCEKEMIEQAAWDFSEVGGGFMGVYIYMQSVILCKTLK